MKIESARESERERERGRGRGRGRENSLVAHIEPVHLGDFMKSESTAEYLPDGVRYQPQI